MRQHFYHGFTKLHRDISVIRKPTIAMINGAAVGSGMDMSLHCDIRIGCEKARFIGYQQAGQIMENRLLLSSQDGRSRTGLEFAYTGSLDAERAYEWGLLNHLVSSEELEQNHPRALRPDHCAAAVGAMDQQAHNEGCNGQHAGDHDGPYVECRRYPTEFR